MDAYYDSLSDADRELIDRIADDTFEPPRDRTPLELNAYRAYIQSPEWQHVRDLAFEYYGYRCVLCDSAKKLNVHHRTYARLGQERLTDLIVLCRICHARFHGKAAA